MTRITSGRSCCLMAGKRRAADGLHLAIAAARQAKVFTFDHGMAEADTAVDVAVELIL